MSNIKSLVPPGRFIGCDGYRLSDELLEAQLKSAVEREDYEDCAVIRDELERRRKTPKYLINFSGGEVPPFYAAGK